MTSLIKDLAKLTLAATLAGCVPQHPKTPLREPIYEDVAIVLVDMQDDFLISVSEEEKEREIPYQLDVLSYAGNHNIPVFVLEYENWGRTTDVLRNKANSLNDTVYITKREDNGFTGTNLGEQLKEKGVEHILLMGIYARACVMETARGALENGFNIMTSKELIADEKYQMMSETGLEGVNWYGKMGIHRDNYKDLLDIITKDVIEENLPKK